MKIPHEIRAADPETDFPAILAGAGDFVRFVNRPDILPGPASVELAGAVKFLLGVPGMTVLLAEIEGVVFGGVGVLVNPYIFNLERVSCEEIFWWCYPEAPPETAMLLLRAAKAHGKANGATVFMFHALEQSPPGVDLAYRRMGTKPLQTTYMGVG